MSLENPGFSGIIDVVKRLGGKSSNSTLTAFHANGYVSVIFHGHKNQHV